MSSPMISSLPDHWPKDSDWTEVLRNNFVSESFRSLNRFVKDARNSSTVFPEAENVYNAFRFCSFEATKIVILGQDPYHGPGQAHGLSFSVQGDQKLPPSLKNMFKEMKADVGCENDSGDLTEWACQGVLLLNTVLTVTSGKAHSHKGRGWERFTDLVFEKLGQRKKPIVFILWGNHAAKKSKLIGEHHHIIQSAHPSPLSAHRGFFGSRPFSQANEKLKKFGHLPINWQLSPN